MEQYIWLAAIFIAASLSYWAGVAFGKAGIEKPETDNAIIKAREIIAKSNVEIQKYRIDKEHEETMEMIRRGKLDGMQIDDDEKWAYEDDLD